MKLKLTDYRIEKLTTGKGHLFLVGHVSKGTETVNGKFQIFLNDSKEEKKLFENCELELEGEFIESDSGTSHHLLNTRIISSHLISDIPLDNLSIKDRLNATGLIHEFRDCFRKDKIRAMEILKVLGVSDKYAEEILLRNSYILPFI